MAEAQPVYTRANPKEVQVFLADCLYFSHLTYENDPDTDHEYYLGFFNFTYQVKYVNMTIFDRNRSSQLTRQTNIHLYAILGPDNYGPDHPFPKGADFSPGKVPWNANLNWGVRRVAETEVSVDSSVFSLTSDFNPYLVLDGGIVRLINGGELDRWLMANCKKMWPATQTELDKDKLQVLRSTNYYAFQQRDNIDGAASDGQKQVCRVVDIGNRTIRTNGGFKTCDLEFWSRIDDNGINDKIKHVQTMVGWLNMHDETTHAFLANQIRPRDDTTMTNVFLLHTTNYQQFNETREDSSGIEHFTHQLYYNVRFFIVYVSKHVPFDNFAHQCTYREHDNVTWSKIGKDQAYIKSFNGVKGHVSLAILKKPYIAVRTFDAIHTKDIPRIGHDMASFNNGFAYWNDFWLTQYARKGDKLEDKWQQRYFHDFFIGNCSRNKVLNETALVYQTKEIKLSEMPEYTVCKDKTTFKLDLKNLTIRNERKFFSGRQPIDNEDIYQRDRINEVIVDYHIVQVEAFKDISVHMYDMETADDAANRLATEQSIENNTLLRNKFDEEDQILVMPVRPRVVSLMVRNRGEVVAIDRQTFEVIMPYPEKLRNYYFISDFNLDSNFKRYCGVKNIPRNVRTYVTSREALMKAIFRNDVADDPEDLHHIAIIKGVPNIIDDNTTSYQQILYSELRFMCIDAGFYVFAYIAQENKAVVFYPKDTDFYVRNPATNVLQLVIPLIVVLCCHENIHKKIFFLKTGRFRMCAVQVSLFRHALSVACSPMFDTLLKYPIVQFSDEDRGLNYLAGLTNKKRNEYMEYPKDPGRTINLYHNAVKGGKCANGPLAQKRLDSPKKTGGGGGSGYGQYRTRQVNALGLDQADESQDIEEGDEKVDSWWSDVSLSSVLGSVAAAALAGAYYLYC